MGSGLTGHKRTFEFGTGPKIEGVGKRGVSSTLGLIIFGVSSQKIYSFEIFREFRIYREEILAKSLLGGQTGQSDGHTGQWVAV